MALNLANSTKVDRAGLELSGKLFDNAICQKIGHMYHMDLVFVGCRNIRFPISFETGMGENEL